MNRAQAMLTLTAARQAVAAIRKDSSLPVSRIAAATRAEIGILELSLVLLSVADATDEAQLVEQLQQDSAAEFTHQEVRWIVNDNGELGVHVGGDYHFLYKGGSLIYKDGLHSNGLQMYVRPVGKREFGECAYPINREDPSENGKVSLEDSSDWIALPPSTNPKAV